MRHADEDLAAYRNRAVAGTKAESAALAELGVDVLVVGSLATSDSVAAPRVRLFRIRESTK